MKIKIYFQLFIVLVPGLFLSCKKQFDLPPIKQASDGARITIAAVKARYSANSIYKFRGDTNLYCVVTADEVSGNLYKEAYVGDATGGLHLKLIAAGGLFIGDSIRINLNGILLNSASDLIQLDSVDTDQSVVKLASGLSPQPEAITLSQLTDSKTTISKFQSRLIKLASVEFPLQQQNQPYGNVVTKAALQYTLQDCSHKQILLRTSGYCYFANQTTPSGNGSITGILSQFNGNLQIILRNPSEVFMTGALCQTTTPATNSATTYVSKNFEDGSLTSGGWNSINVSGSVNWTVKTSTNISNPTKISECNNFIGSGNQPACETWLVSPGFDLSGAAVPTFSFTSAVFFSGPPLQTLISTDYLSGPPASATWSALPAVYATGASHTSSGNIDLLAYRKPNVHIAFKYTGNAGSGQRWQVDNIRIGE